MKPLLRLLAAFTWVLAFVLATAASPSNGQSGKALRAVSAVSSMFIENAGQWDARAQFLSQANGLNLWVTAEGPLFEFRKFIPTGVTHHSTEGSESTEEEAISKGVAGSSSLLRLPGSPNGARIVSEGSPNGARILSEGRSPGNCRPLNSESPEGAKLPSLPGQGYIKGHVVKMTFINANPSAITGQSVQKSKFNYFLGNDKTKWVSNARSYAQVTAERPYDGISIRYSIDQGTPRYDVIVKPGADPSQVGIKIEGADDARVLENGNLELKTSLGTVEERGLTAYQETPNGRTQVPCKMVMDGNTVHFDTGSYDPAKTLVIDPLVASTYLGGSDYQAATSVALDSANDIYVTGNTDSPNFPTTAGAYQSTLIQNLVFVAKLDPTETSLLYSSVFGGSKSSSPSGIAIDGNGDAFIGGITNSSDFPVSNGAFQTHTNAGANLTCFVLKFNPLGNELLYSTYVSGNVSDVGAGIALDSLGNAIIAGYTSSNKFPVTVGAFQTTNKTYVAGQTYSTGFVTKLNATGTGLIYSTYLGGSGNSDHYGEAIYGLTSDSAGNAVVCGTSASPDFPITAGVYQPNNAEETNGYGTGFITKLNQSGAQLVFSTFLGGSGGVAAAFGDEATGVALDSSGNVTVVGFTASQDFPVTAGAYRTAGPPQAGLENFVSRLNATGTTLISSTFFGGARGINGIAIDSLGNTILVGQTNNSGFVTTSNGFQTVDQAPNGYLGYVSEISADGKSLIYSSYLGGTNGNFNSGTGDQCYAVALNGGGNPVIVGVAGSTDFPTTAGAVESIQPGTTAGFVTTLGISPFASFTITPNSVVGGNSCTGSITLASPVSTNTFVALSSSSAFVTVPTSVELATGSISNTFNVSTSAATGEVYITATLGSSSQTVAINLVSSALAGVQVAPSAVLGGTSATGTVQLNIASEQGTLSVQLSSNSGAATVPTTVTVPLNATSATFPISTNGVNISTPVTITATYASVSEHATLTVDPPVISSVSPSPASVIGGSSSTGTVQLSGPAGPLGQIVSLHSSTSKAVVPASVKVASGANSAQFQITTSAVSSSTQATLTASYTGSSQTTVLTVAPATLSRFSMADAVILGTTSTVGTVEIGSPAGPNGDVVKLSSSTIRAIVPTAVTVPAGQTSVSFTVNTTVVSSDTVAFFTATYGLSSLTSQVIVLPAPLSSLTVNPTSLVGGSDAMLTVTLAGVAGPYGNVIKFASSSPELEIPATETIPSGLSSYTFAVPTSAVSSTTLVTITDTFWVYSQTTTLTVTPALITGLTFSANPVIGGQTTTATVHLGSIAGPTGDVVKVMSNLGDATVPPTVTVPAGQTTAQFTIQTVAVSSLRTAQITVTLGTSSIHENLEVSP